MKRVLITGGFGFAGGRIARRLAADYKVIVSSRTQPGAGMLALHHDPDYINHSELLEKKHFPEGIDTVIHMAALNERDCLSRPSEAIQVNIDQTRIILDNAISRGVSRFFYFSTAHIYGSPLQGLINESTLPAPQHPYAITHRAAEDYVVAATRQNKISGNVLRLSNSFGAPVTASVNRWTLLANDLAKQAVEKRSVSLVSNGCQFRDFITLEDVENAVFQMLAVDASKFPDLIYNLGSGRSMRVIDMAERIISNYKELFGHTINIRLPQNAAPSVEPLLTYSNEQLLAAGIHLSNDVDKELKNLLKFCSENFKYMPV